MDTLSIVSSVSKIAILAFLITLGIVIFEVVTLMRKNKRKVVHQQEVDIPEFDQEKAGEHHFTELPDITAAPVEKMHKGISRSILLAGGIAVIVIVTGVAIWIFNRSTLTARKAKKETSPIAESAKTSPTVLPTLSDIQFESPPSASQGAMLTTTPTSLYTNPTTRASLAPTRVPTSGSVLITTTPGIYVTTRITSPTAGTSASVTNTTPGMPQSGTFQITLLLTVVSIALIYLALIL